MPTLDWIGKEAVVNHHLEVPYRLLKCNSTLSAGDVEAGNLLVLGDNLLALKALLPYYAGEVKCIYIDPPYNTKNETWVYNDNVNSPEIRLWLKQIVGKEGEDLSRHDKWLCMMYPRLQLLWKFLCPDGVIFISIDENEFSNLVQICDDIFGRNRRLAFFSWVRKKKGSNLSKELRKITEYVVSYKRSLEKIELFGVPAYAEKQVPLLNRANPVSKLKFDGGVMKVGQGVSDGLIKQQRFGDGELTVELENEIIVRNQIIERPFTITGRFRWSQSTVQDEIANGSIFTASKTFRINVARYNQTEKFKPPTSLLSSEDGIGTNEDATEELREIFPELHKLPFDFPKPTSLVNHLIRSVTREEKQCLILDSFAGSGTTGHAVLQLNKKEDSGNRRFILVEMDHDICQNVTAERLNRVISGYGDKEPLGGGFRYCKLGEPLFDEFGNLRNEVSFNDLAHHIFFTETGMPLPKNAKKNSPLIGNHKGVAYYLLFNGILRDKSIHGGNILTSKILEQLPKHDGPKVIYGEGTRVSLFRLRKSNISFKQVPYEIKTS